MKKVTSFEIKGEILTLHYFDDTEPSLDSHSASVNWKVHPEVKKVLYAMMEVLGTYLLTDNKNLLEAQQEDLEELFQKLLKEPPTEGQR